MKKAHQFLPNIAFFGAIGLVYLGLPSWGNLFACVVISVFVYFDEIKEETAFKYSTKHIGSMLLFVPLAYFQLSVLPIGILPFLVGFLITHFRLTNFQGNASKVLLTVGFASVLGFYLPNKLSHLQVHTELNEAAPDFTIQNFKTGENLTKSDLKGKIVIANFWATWCGTCIKEMVPLNGIYERYKDNPEVVFLAINTPKWSPDEVSQIENFLDKKNITLPVYLDNSNEMTEGFDVSSIPTLFILDKEGNMRVRHIGFPAGEDLGKYLDEQITALL